MAPVLKVTKFLSCRPQTEQCACRGEPPEMGEGVQQQGHRRGEPPGYVKQAAKGVHQQEEDGNNQQKHPDRRRYRF